MYPHYRHDEFVDVTDEVWAAMYQAQREMENYERRKVYHRAYYSLDAYSWLENYALEHSRSPVSYTHLERPVYGTFDNRQVLFRTELQLVADPLSLIAFFPHDLRVKIPFHGKSADLNQLDHHRHCLLYTSRCV